MQPNYRGNKRRREEANKKKQEEKRLRRLNKGKETSGEVRSEVTGETPQQN